MLILDTDHLAELERVTSSGRQLAQKLDESGDEIVTTIISAEEQLRGWLAQINRLRDPHRQIEAYGRLQGRLEFFAAWRLLPWDGPAATRLQSLQDQRVRVGTMDLKIACIALAHDGTLLSRNLRDFRKVPALKVENWL